MKEAKRKISQIDELKIIGITGSYGKTTTKETLHMILQTRFKTYSTPGNVNTEIGVAQTILDNLSWIADVFIVEMGAYKKGEIRKICEIAKPDISVITAVSDQHIALFGDLENILRAKYEIVEYSKNEAVVVLNGDNDLCLRLAGKSGKKEILYSTTKEVEVYATDIKSKKDRLEFNVHANGKVQRFEVKALGEYNVSNILASTSIALQLGMNLKEISKALKEGSKMRQIGRLSTRRSKYGYRILDDSYNSNSAGFAAALDYLDGLKADKKILVTLGIIELGEKKDEVYEFLSKRIVKVADVLLTSDERLKQSVQKANSRFNIIFDKGINKQLQFLKTQIKKNDVVLFEGPNLRLMEEVVK